MNNKANLLFAVLLLSSVFTVVSPCAVAQTNNKFGIKDETYSYYQKCLKNLNDPDVLQMIDTLYQMSVKDSDERMQVVCYSTRMDYYYHKEIVDSMLANSMRTRKFAREKNLPRYYYHSWARVITYYINHHYLQTALIELEKMQKEALKENDGEAIFQSFQTMGRVYNAWDKHEESARYFDQAIDFINSNTDLEQKYLLQHLTFLYATSSNQYTLAGMYEKAEENAIKSREYQNTLSDSLQTCLSFAELYVALGKEEKAKLYIDTLKALGYPYQNRDLYMGVEMRYYASVGNYRRALQICDDIIEFQYNKRRNLENYYNKAYYLEHMGKYKEAIEGYNKYYRYIDSINKYKFSQELSEQAVLMRVKQLEAEKQKFELRAKNRWLLFSIIAFAVVLVILIIMIKQFYKRKSLYIELQKSERIKSIFLQNLSHEVRTPLNSIMGFSDIMANTGNLQGGEYSEYSKIIHDNARQLLILFNEALDASEVQTAKEKRLTNINELCTAAVMEIRKNCNLGVKVVFDPCEEDATQMIDQSAVKKVIDNLLQNAAKFTKKGKITVKTQYLTKTRFMISVSDTGPGISADEQDKVFESFYKSNDMSQGIGLGLTLSRVLADSMNGSITIDNSYFDGCRINFVFPV